ncbi:Integron integrase [Lacticaseibacillus paracasei subsp. paracasei Lpp14]|jgi:hypothetical protein|uniref:Integron integrase n=1 Tax=Lacticaseibacillus paracasei subsp. paracasei Lpp14 TaxID=1256204 RepID=A0A829GIW8_LACPA|nr:Integron integrase [Lacticaseibacillus paracasei subsp. paracasei Lpp14]
MLENTALDLASEKKICAPGWQPVAVSQHFVRINFELLRLNMIRQEYFFKVYNKIRGGISVDSVFVHSHAPNAVITGSMATFSLSAQIIHDKCELDVPTL